MEVTWSVFKSFVSSRSLSVQYVDTNDTYYMKAFDGLFMLSCNLYKLAEDTTEVADFETNFKALGNKPPTTEPQPFAIPAYRTKRDASEWTDCPANSTTTLDFLLTAERYVSGGEIIFKGAKKGDYLTAEVYDKDGVIPAPYRAALCEAHPSVATYIVKKQLKPCEGYDSFEINTYPLNAKISAGLYLRVSYVSTAETGTREVVVNYHLTKKL
jgi:hypothetical protein